MTLHNQRAFTFIELIIVLMMVGILSALSWEGQKGLLKRHQLQGVAKTLVSDLRAAQQQAITTRNRCWIRFDPEQHGYTIGITTGDGQDRLVRQVRLPAAVRFGATPGVKGPPGNPVEAVEADGITFKNNRVIFMPSGGLGSGAGTVYLTHDPSGHGTRAVTVTVSGRVRLYEWKEGGWQ